MRRAFVCVVLAALAAGCLAPKDGNLAYFEVVYQDPSCGGGLCFDEILAMQDGLVFMKKGRPYGNYSVSFCRADGRILASLLSDLDDSLKGSTLEECSDCITYHVFYNDGLATRYSSVPEGLQTFQAGFYGRAKDICADVQSADLIHVIWGRNGEFVDYHLFSNGVAVYERFGLREGELLDSRAYRMDAGGFGRMARELADGFFTSNTTNNCPKNGLFYGYVEASIGGVHAEHFTCGDGTPAGRTFQTLAKSRGWAP